MASTSPCQEDSSRCDTRREAPPVDARRPLWLIIAATSLLHPEREGRGSTPVAAKCNWRGC
jgi:hypothetical protein